MATQRLTFGEWLPDQPGISGSLTEAKNVISQAIGYGPLPKPVSIASGAGQSLYTLHHAKKANGDTLLFAGGGTSVFSVSAVGVFTDVSGISYNTPSADRIRFTQFGKSTIFTNNADMAQKRLTAGFLKTWTWQTCPPCLRQLTRLGSWWFGTSRYQAQSASW
jgi:hypothetical protein